MYIIIIQCRMGSTRLPGKILKKLFDKEILLWCYERCCKSKVDKVYIATSINKENDIVEKMAEDRKIPFFRGSEYDLLDRYYQLCKINVDNCENLNIIRVTSDCPFIDYSIIDSMIDVFQKGQYDYLINHSVEGITPEGSTTEIINFKSLEYLWANEKSPDFREHATGMLVHTTKYDLVIKKGTYKYYLPEITSNMKYIKLSVDTEEDYQKSVKIANYFRCYNFSYSDILKAIHIGIL
jgi:spore coat polysaccharide biosynthesis protein SpsF